MLPCDPSILRLKEENVISVPLCINVCVRVCLSVSSILVCVCVFHRFDVLRCVCMCIINSKCVCERESMSFINPSVYVCSVGSIFCVYHQSKVFRLVKKYENEKMEEKERIQCLEELIPIYYLYINEIILYK